MTRIKVSYGAAKAAPLQIASGNQAVRIQSIDKESEMNFLSKLLLGIAFVPAIGAEHDRGDGRSRRREHCRCRQVSGRPGQGDRWVVQCLNASAWSKTKSA